MSYFRRVGKNEFLATEHVSGAWAPDEQHVAPLLGLMTHIAETDHAARRSDTLQLCRLSFDILGVMTMEDPIHITTEVLRPGRSIELVGITASQNGRAAVLLHGWFVQTGDTQDFEASSFPPIPPREEMEPFNPSDVWHGGFIGSTDVVRIEREPGHAATWVRTRYDLLDTNEPVSSLATAMSFLDITNGLTVRAQPTELMFPNVDLTAHFFRHPQGPWIGFETKVSFGPNGIGQTSSVVYDEHGPVGTSEQILTVRRR